MRLGCFLISILITFAVNCNAAVAKNQSNQAALSQYSAHSASVVENNGPSQRFLRTEGVSDEERGKETLPSSFVAKLVRKDSLRERTFQDWAKVDDGIDLDGLRAVLKATTNKAKIEDQKALLKLYEKFLG